jgi:hypothetical protein
MNNSVVDSTQGPPRDILARSNSATRKYELSMEYDWTVFLEYLRRWREMHQSQWTSSSYSIQSSWWKRHVIVKHLSKLHDDLTTLRVTALDL